MQYFKVLGIVHEERDLIASYVLCYTANKQKALNYYLSQGWEKQNIRFIPLNKSKVKVIAPAFV